MSTLLVGLLPGMVAVTIGFVLVLRAAAEERRKREAVEEIAEARLREIRRLRAELEWFWVGDRGAGV